MATTIKKKPSLRVGDEAVKAKTGKNWSEWFTLLDKAGAKKMSHQDIVKFLSSKHDVGPWWQQMVTVAYEQASGLRRENQRPNGYQISVSRTLNASLGASYKAFADEKLRAEWLGEKGLVVRRATPNKTMRLTWKDKATSMEVYFTKKDANKTQVVVQHTKLPDATAATKMKTYWGKKLDRLRTTFE